MMKERRWLRGLHIFYIAVLVIAFTSISGCMGGHWFFRVTAKPMYEWNSLGHPPERNPELVTADFDTVYVRTENQTVYACYWVTPYDNDCWTEIVGDPKLRWKHGEPIKGPDYPDEILDSIAVEYPGRYYAAAKYVLLEDGTIMKWTTGGFVILRAHRLVARYLLSLYGGYLLGAMAGLALTLGPIRSGYRNSLSILTLDS